MKNILNDISNVMNNVNWMQKKHKQRIYAADWIELFINVWTMHVEMIENPLFKVELEQ